MRTIDSSGNLPIDNQSIQGLKSQCLSLKRRLRNLKLVSIFTSAIWGYCGISIPIWTAFRLQQIGAIYGVLMPILGIIASAMFFNGIKKLGFVTYMLAVWFGRFGFYGTKESILFIAFGAAIFWFSTRYVPRIESETMTALIKANKLLISTQL